MPLVTIHFKRFASTMILPLLLIWVGVMGADGPLPVEAEPAGPQAPEQSEPITLYDRHQGIVYRGEDNHIYRLIDLGSEWRSAKLTDAGQEAAGEPFLFDDGGPQVVYRGADGHLHHLVEAGHTWEHAILTLGEDQKAAGDPMAYTFGDSHILYRGVDDLLHEIVMGSDGPEHYLLTFAEDSTMQGDPFGWVRETQHIIYRGRDNRINWLTFDAETGWTHSHLPGEGIPQPAGDPMAYGIGTDHVIYRGDDDHLHELVLDGDRWTHYQLTFGADQMLAGEPFGFGFFYDDIPAEIRHFGQHILYRGIDDRIHNLYFIDGVWTHMILTPADDALAAGDPMAYANRDEWVVYRDQNDQIQRLVWRDTRWEGPELLGANDMPLAGDPSGRFHIWQNGQRPAFPLRALADARGIDLGATVNHAAFVSTDDPLYREVLAGEFNMVTAENVMKFVNIQPAQGVYDFERADALVEFAQENGMAIRGHTLVWHNQLPAWLEDGTWTRDELIAILEDHIATVVGRYAGEIKYWDVVNEAIDDGTGQLRSSFWLAGIGPDYIDIAFNAARAADPDAGLFYNDYGAEALNQKSDAIYDLVADLVARGIPIDGVGLQMHTNTDHPPPVDTTLANIDRLAALGLEVQFTEMDVRTTIGFETFSGQRLEQAVIYKETMALCLSRAACTGFALWGFTDRYSWIYSFVGTSYPAEAPLLFDPDYAPKPAYFGLRDALGAAPYEANMPIVGLDR